MDVNFEFESDNRLCVYRIGGPITVSGMMQVFAKARAHTHWSDSYDFLTLLDHASLAAMPAEAMTKLQAQMAAADPVRDGPRRRAAIVCNDKLSRAMLAYWEMIAGGTLTTEERVFVDEVAARNWLAQAR